MGDSCYAGDKNPQEVNLIISSKANYGPTWIQN